MLLKLSNVTFNIRLRKLQSSPVLLRRREDMDQLDKPWLKLGNKDWFAHNKGLTDPTLGNAGGLARPLLPARSDDDSTCPHTRLSTPSHCTS